MPFVRFLLPWQHGISITRTGALVANMPLHAVESVFATVKFSTEPAALTLEGDGMSYTYTVPPALLARRSIDDST